MTDMRFILSYKHFLNESEANSFFDLCEQYMQGTDIWQGMKERVRNMHPTYRIIEDTDIASNAQFDAEGSSPQNIIILVNPAHEGFDSYEGTMAHELTHALQYLRDGELDLFVTDATREFSTLSDEEIWQDLMLGIYLVDPIEIEAWRPELMHHDSSTIDYMVKWMDGFEPVEYARLLGALTPNENEWELESFEDFPELWATVRSNYVGGGEPEEESETLLEFLQGYNRKFKGYRAAMGL